MTNIDMALASLGFENTGTGRRLDDNHKITDWSGVINGGIMIASVDYSAKQWTIPWLYPLFVGGKNIGYQKAYAKNFIKSASKISKALLKVKDPWEELK